MFQIIRAAVATLTTTLVFATPAFATNPHFVGDATARCQGPDLLVSFKVAGLGEGETVLVSAEGDATKRCINRGNNIPPGQTEDVSSSGIFGPASKNGNISGTLRLESEEECSPGHRLQVTYEDVLLELEDGDTLFLEGTFVCQ